MKIAIIGTVGVPANYGGFETLVENLIEKKCSADIKYIVFCSSKSYPEKRAFYKNAHLKYIPLKANGISSTLYDIISLIWASFTADVIVILGVSGCCFLPVYRFFSKKKLIINIDGLEHKRGKWGRNVKKFLKFSEAMAIKYADTIVTDNKGIQDYILKVYGKVSTLIAYGGDHVIGDISLQKQREILEKYELKDKVYSFSVCRIEPENNVHLILQAFEKAKQRLFFVGNWGNSDYGKKLWEKYKFSDYVQLLSPIYDLDVLNIFRSNCEFYIHGHGAGGTNPSLVEAMFFGRPVLAFDVVYNRETTENRAKYFSSADELMDLLKSPCIEYGNNGEAMAEIANRRYLWKDIAVQYETTYYI